MLCYESYFEQDLESLGLFLSQEGESSRKCGCHYPWGLPCSSLGSQVLLSPFHKEGN